MQTYKIIDDAGIGGYVVSLSPDVLDTGLDITSKGLTLSIGDLVLFGSGGSGSVLVSSTPAVISADYAGKYWHRANRGSYATNDGAGTGNIISAAVHNGGTNYTITFADGEEITVDIDTAVPKAGDLLLFGFAEPSSRLVVQEDITIIPANELSWWDDEVAMIYISADYHSFVDILPNHRFIDIGLDYAHSFINI